MIVVHCVIVRQADVHHAAFIIAFMFHISFNSKKQELLHLGSFNPVEVCKVHKGDPIRIILISKHLQKCNYCFSFFEELLIRWSLMV